jgi:hypothetical protein
VQYETDRHKLIRAAESLLACVRDGSDEDAQQWAIQILNGLYGVALEKFVKLRNALDAAKD